MSKIGQRFRTALSWSLGLTVVIWGVYLLDTYVFREALRFDFGLWPRQPKGIWGIFTSPFFHGSWGHLLNNSFPFITLSGFLVFFYPRLWPRIGAFLWVATGLGAWIIAGGGVHIGASGVIFALAAFLAASGIFRRDFRTIAVSLIVIFYYGSMFAGVLPGKEGISWESHLSGFLMGIIGAWTFKNQLEDHEIEARRRKEQRRLQAESPEQPFLPDDAFKKTKAERQQEAFWEKLERDMGDRS